MWITDNRNKITITHQQSSAVNNDSAKLCLEMNRFTNGWTIYFRTNKTKQEDREHSGPPTKIRENQNRCHCVPLFFSKERVFYSYPLFNTISSTGLSRRIKVMQVYAKRGECNDGGGSSPA